MRTRLTPNDAIEKLKTSPIIAPNGYSSKMTTTNKVAYHFC